MGIRDIIKMGDPRLLAANATVADVRSEAIQQLIADMWDTMAAAGGIGLAAPQIGVNLQVIVLGTGEPSQRYPDRAIVPRTVLINPEVQPAGDETEDDWEGCLSIPDLRGAVPRWRSIHYRGLNERGEPVEQLVQGFHARVVQHEFDHLQGILYPMRMRDLSKFGYTEVLFPDLA